MLCESPGLGIRRCSTTLEDVTFLERSFNASITDKGQIEIDTGLTHDMTMSLVIPIIILLVINFVYAVKIVLEMNLGFSVVLNAIDFFSIFLLEAALFICIFNTMSKRSLEIDLLDSSTFVDLTMLYTLDKYSLMALNLSMVFYPFRFFGFISRFNFSTPIKGTLNTILRMSPGLFTYFVIVLIVAICVTTSSMLLLSPDIPAMNTFLNAFFMTFSVNFF